MEYIRPDIGVNGEFARYRINKNNKLYLAKLKDPVYNYSTLPSHCREILIGFIKSNICNGSRLDEFRNYLILPNAKIETKSGTRFLKSSIILRTGEITDTKFFISSKVNIKRLKQILDYILGITSVCLSHSDVEIERRKSNIGLANDFTIKNYSVLGGLEFSYNVLSPFWTVSPIMVSFITGLARSCYQLLINLTPEYLNNYLFNLATHNEICEIINKVDYENAKDFYNKVILNFFNSKDVRDYHRILLSTELHQSTLKDLIENGYEYGFKPDKMLRYWYKFSNRYGFNRMCNYFQRERNKGYNYYRNL